MPVVDSVLTRVASEIDVLAQVAVDGLEGSPVAIVNRAAGNDDVLPGAALDGCLARASDNQIVAGHFLEQNARS